MRAGADVMHTNLSLERAGGLDLVRLEAERWPVLRLVPGQPSQSTKNLTAVRVPDLRASPENVSKMAQKELLILGLSPWQCSHIGELRLLQSFPKQRLPSEKSETWSRGA